MIRTTAACIAALAGLANAGTIVLNVDSSQSSIGVDATLISPVGTATDSGTSTVSGIIEIALDDDGNPTMITLHDFALALDNDVSLNFDYGFFGSADVTLNDAMALYADAGNPLGPVSISGSAFAFADVPATLGGNADYEYSFFLVGSGSDSIVLSDLGVFGAPLAGNITSDGQTVTLSGALTFAIEEPVLDGLATLQLSGTAALVATGSVPSGGGCNAADIAEPYDVLDLADIGTFVNAFTTGDDAADLAAPFGVFDLADLNAFLTAFTAGCP